MHGDSDGITMQSGPIMGVARPPAAVQPIGVVREEATVTGRVACQHGQMVMTGPAPSATPAPASAWIFSVVCTAALFFGCRYWWRRARNDHAPPWQRLDALSMVVGAAAVIGLLNWLVVSDAFGGSERGDDIMLAVFVAGTAGAAIAQLLKVIMRFIDDRQHRKLRQAMGLPVRRALWHPGLIAGAWLLGLCLAVVCVPSAGQWALDSYLDGRPITALESERLVGVVFGVLGTVVVVGIAGGVTHLLVQVMRRRRDAGRVHRLEQEQLVGAVVDPGPPG